MTAMAKCPHCQKKLHFWNIKAECPHCNENIPNYNWEERLLLDAENAEAAFLRMHQNTARFKSGLCGSRLRIARLVLTFSPLIMLVLPMAKISIALPYLTVADKGVSFLDLILALVNGSIIDLSGVIATAKLPMLSGIDVSVLSVLLALIGFVFAVLNFFALIFGSIKHNYIANIICGCLSIALLSAAAIMLPIGLKQFAGNAISVFTGSVGIAFIVGLVCVSINLVLNLLSIKELKKENS